MKFGVKGGGCDSVETANPSETSSDVYPGPIRYPNIQVKNGGQRLPS